MSAEQEDGPWSGKAGLGYLATSGNSESSSLNALFRLSYNLTNWHHQFGAQAISNVTSDVTTAERYQLNFKSKYDFTEHDYVFGLVSWEKDRFSGYEEQLSEAIGYGRRLLNSDTQILNVELGLGAKQADLSDGTRETGVIGRAGLDYLWKFSDTADFTQLLAVESGSGNTYIESVTAVTAKLMESLALSVSYTIKNNSDVPVGRDKSDTFTAINLEYAF
ncbi:MAG: DUF481 domain-containing protein [Gammaproteobacteria bacterium]|nr:DUF481 domain-containing protein [Gammaproteobacteria bacterium]